MLFSLIVLGSTLDIRGMRVLIVVIYVCYLCVGDVRLLCMVCC